MRVPSRRRLTRPLRHPGRYLRRLSPTQWTLVLVITAAVVVGSLAAVMLIRTPQNAPTPLAGSPLNNPSLSPGTIVSGNPQASASVIPLTPVTVRLIVPSAGIDIAVIDGDGIHVPLATAMHYPGTAEPGAGSTSLFYAHARRGMFLGLFSVHAGDEIRVVRADGSVLRYSVHEIRRIPWDDLDILRPTQFDQLILLTCTTYSPYDPRYIVIGTPT